MKKHITLLLALLLLLSACSVALPDSTASIDDTKNTAMETQNGTTGTTEGSTATEGSEETSSTVTTLGTEHTEGTEGTTDSTTGYTDPTQEPTVTTTPTTEPSITEPPATEPPATEPPTTEPPATEPPTTEPPVTEPPVTEPPTTEPPVTEPPTTEAPATEQPTKPTTPSTPAQPAVTLTINTKAFTTVSVGNTLQIDYTYSGNKSDLTWYIDGDTSVATVDNSGLLTAKAAGSVGVVVTNGSLTKVVSIIVSDAPKATSVETDGFNAPLYDGVTKYAGDYMSFRAYTLPVESNRDIVVTSSNRSVVSVSWEMDSHNKNWVTLNFKSAGTATVIIKSADGSVSKSYSITVRGDYACNPGSGQLTPEQFVDCVNAVIVANGATINTAQGYRELTLSAEKLTWAVARDLGEGWIHEFWPNGSTDMGLSYHGVDDGDYVFYIHR